MEAPPDSSSAAEAPAVDSSSADHTWVVNTRGIGKLSAGMTLKEANAVLDGTLIIPAKLEECDWVRVRGAPDGLLMMVQKGRISRIDIIRSSTIETGAGAKIGDTEARIKALYPGRVAVEPHAYTDGHYLVFTPPAAADSSFRIVFETDGQKVLRYRSGLMPAVEYVEGCS
ncbi:MAG: hypothetical protein ACSLFK_02790 [Gemmatimonadaceae bacterium]